MRTSSLLFLLGAWTFVLSLAGWSFRRLLATPREEELPPPGAIP
jgi:hypothetical protein